jgi:hypothetical protein
VLRRPPWPALGSSRQTSPSKRRGTRILSPSGSGRVGLTETYVNSYLQTTYQTDAAVAGDRFLQAWIAASSAPDGGNIRGLPEMNSRTALASVLTSLIYRVTVHCGRSAALVHHRIHVGAWARSPCGRTSKVEHSLAKAKEGCVPLESPRCASPLWSLGRFEPFRVAFRSVLWEVFIQLLEMLSPLFWPEVEGPENLLRLMIH